MWLRKLLRLVILKLLPKRKRGRYRTPWKVTCTWGESNDVSLTIDNSTYLMFGFSYHEARRLANGLHDAADLAEELDTGYLPTRDELYSVNNTTLLRAVSSESQPDYNVYGSLQPDPSFQSETTATGTLLRAGGSVSPVAQPFIPPPSVSAHVFYGQSLNIPYVDPGHILASPQPTREESEND